MKAQRLRACRQRAGVIIPASAVDLVDLLARLNLASATEQPARDIMREYDLVLTPMVLRADDERTRNRPSIALIEAKRRNLAAIKTPESREQIAELSRERAVYLTRIARRDERIADRNEQFLDRLLKVLSAGDARLLQQHFDLAAYSPVLPSPGNPTSLMASIIQDDAIPHDAREAIRGMWNAHDQVVTTVAADVRDRFREWKAELASSMSGKNYAAYRQRMAEVLTRMCDAHDQLVSQATALLPAAVAAAFESEIAAWRAAAAQRRAEIAGGEFPPP